MGLLNTSVCAAIIGLALAGAANAQDAGLHPQLGKKPPLELLNKDLLELPKQEQQAWVHGAMSQLVQSIGIFDVEKAKCVQDWYFGIGNGTQYIPRALEHYKNAPPSATIVAAAKKACPSL